MQTTKAKKWDALFIGSGLSSLVCGILLARRGYSVCLLEQHTLPGGYLHTFKRFSRRFDTGGHYVGAMEPGQPFHTLLSYVGIDPSEFFTPLDPTGFDIFEFPHFSSSIPKGYGEWAARLTAQFPEEKTAIDKYLTILQNAVTFFPTYEFHTDLDSMELASLVQTPLSQVVESLTDNVDLRAVFYAYSALHGVHPRDIAIGFHALVTDSLVRGPFAFSRGGDPLAQALIALLKKFGGEVRLNTRVTKLETDDKEVRTVHTAKGETFQADWVISSAHPKNTFAMVGEEHFSPAFNSRMAKLKESSGVLGVYARCNQPTEFTPRQNHYCFTSTDPDLWFAKELTDVPPFVYIVRPDRLGTTKGTDYPLTIHAPANYEWFKEWDPSLTQKRPDAYYALKEKLCDGAIALADRFHPGLKEAILHYDGSTPLTNLHYNGSVDGSAYGVYHSFEATGARAIGPRTHVRNLLLTGQNSLFPGLMGAAVSGLRTAGHLLGMKDLVREIVEFRSKYEGLHHRDRGDLLTRQLDH